MHFDLRGTLWRQRASDPHKALPYLILTEERISLVICDVPVASARLLAQAELGRVDCILVGCDEESDQCWEEDGICTLLVARGYSAERSGTAVLFHRDGAQTRRI